MRGYNLSLAEMYTLKANTLDAGDKTIRQMLSMIEQMKSNNN